MSCRSLGRARVWAIAFCWVMADAAAARAQDPAPAVDVTVVGTADDLERVRALAPRLGTGGARWLRVDRLDPADVLRARRDGDAAAVRAWVDITVATRARLYFATRSGERFLVRDLELSGRFDEVDRAALTEVLESSIGALIADERAGLTRAEAEAVIARREPPSPPPPVVRGAPPPQPPTPAPPRPPSQWALGFFYAAQSVADGGTIDHGPGLTLSYTRARPVATTHETGRGPVVFAGAQYRLLLHEQARIGVALYTVATRAGVECGPLWWSRLRVRLGLGADFVHVSPESSDPAATLTPPHWSTGFVATAALRANVVHQPGRFWLSAMLFADVTPTEIRYDVVVDGATTRIFSPWRVRPGLTVEATFF